MARADPAAAADPSLWLPAAPGVATGAVERKGDAAEFYGSRVCIGNYRFELDSTRTETACSLAGGSAVMGREMMDIAGETRRVLNPSCCFFHALASGPGTGYDGGTTWAAFSPAADGGAYVRFTDASPARAYDVAARAHAWSFSLPSEDVLRYASGGAVRLDPFSYSVTPNGRHLVFVSRGAGGVMWLDRASNQIRQLLSMRENIGLSLTRPVAVSPSGRYVAVGVSGFGDNLTIYDTSACVPQEAPNPPDRPSPCPSATLAEILGVPAFSLERVLDVRFIGERIVTFRAKTDRLPGGSATEYRTFTLSARGESAAAKSLFALGDSFTSGEGDPGHYRPGTDAYRCYGVCGIATPIRILDPINQCHQSVRAWPSVLGSLLNASKLTSYACSGATTLNVQWDHQWDRQTGQDDQFPGVVAQREALADGAGATHPDRIVVQIGGNDAAFADIVRRCVWRGECLATTQERREAALAVRDTYWKVGGVLQHLRWTYPHSDVTLVGYPAIVDAEGACALNVRLSAGERSSAVQLQGYIEDVQRASAAYAGVRYVSLSNSIERHQLCDDEPWVNGVRAGEDIYGVLGRESFHPDYRAHHAMAGVVAARVDDPCPDDCRPLDPATPPPPLPVWAQDGITTDMTRQWSAPVRVWPKDSTDRTVRGALGGLRPGTSVTGAFHSEPRPIETKVVGADGELDLAATVPADLPPGEHELHLRATGLNGTSLHSVTQVLVPGPDGDHDADGVLDGDDLCPTIPGDEHDAEDPDGDALGASCDPRLDDGPAADADGDGLGNAQEQAAGTDPDRADTDGDGADDGKELGDGTDPADPSSRRWAPTATLDVTPTTTTVGAGSVVATFGGSDADGDALSYEVDWGDGTSTQTGSLPHSALPHEYARAGAFEVTLTVSDGTEETIARRTVDVGLAGPLDADAGPDLVAFVGDRVTLSGSASTPPGIESYAWDFGDGGQGSGVRADHVYTDAGTYTATLTISAADMSSTDAVRVVVRESPSTTLGRGRACGSLIAVKMEFAERSGTLLAYRYRLGAATAWTQAPVPAGRRTFSATKSVPVPAQATRLAAQALNSAGVWGPVETIGLQPCPPVPLGIGDARVLEGGAGESATAKVTVSVPEPAAGPISFTAVAAAGTATREADFTSPAGTAFTIPTGASSIRIGIPIVGDAAAEGDEALTVRLSAPSPGVTLRDSTATVTIVDDDAPTFVSVDDLSIVEGPVGAGATARFEVRLSRPPGPGRSVAVGFATAGSTATPGSDFVSRAGTLTFAEGVSVLPVAVTVVGDATVELAELFALNLTATGRGVVLADRQATANIGNDDGLRSPAPKPRIYGEDLWTAEGLSGSSERRFRLRLDSAQTSAVSVAVATRDGTAMAGEDFGAATTRVTFPAGATRAEVPVAVVGDVRHEPSESFGLALSAPSSNAILGDPSATATLVDEEGPVFVSVGDARGAEGSAEAPGILRFGISLSESPAAGESIAVDVRTASGTATGGSDYAAVAQRLVFGPGETVATATVPLVGDRLWEVNETLSLHAKPVTASAFAADGTGAGVLVDDD